MCILLEIVYTEARIWMLLFYTDAVKMYFAHYVAYYPEWFASGFFHLFLGGHAASLHRKRLGFFSGHIAFRCLNVPQFI